MARPAGAPPPRVTTDLRSCRQTTLHFHCAFEIRQSQSLAHMLDSLVRVSRRAAHSNAKAEPKIALRFAPAVAQSFAIDGIASQTRPAVAAGWGARSTEHATLVRKRARARHGSANHRRQYKTGQRSPDLSMPTKGKRSAHRPECDEQRLLRLRAQPPLVDRQRTDAYLADDTRRTCA